MTDEQLLALNADFSIHIAEMGPGFYAPILCSDYMSLVARLEAAEAVCNALGDVNVSYEEYPRVHMSLMDLVPKWHAAKGET